MRFYTASKLGSKRSYTPEKFLVCLDVPIARTGEMLYVPHELPGLEAGRDGLIRVMRDPDEVFKPEAMASFVGKPTTNDHPPEMVSPANFRRFAAGSAQNIRRGDGPDSDLLLADLLFADPGTIEAIEGGKDEISCGYDAEYELVSPGVYRQFEIIGNHVAVVAEGRCGERCAIGDSASTLQSTQAADAVLTSNLASPCGCDGRHDHRDAKPARKRKRKTHDMAKTVLKTSMLDRLRRAFTAKDEAAFEETISEAQEAVEASQEEEQTAQLSAMIAAAVQAGVGPIAARLDAVETETADRKARDEAAEAAKTTAARKDETPVKDNENVEAFLKSKGLSEADVAAVCAMIKKEDPGAAATADDGLSEEEKKAKEEADKKEGTTDSVTLLAEFRDTVAKAEVLAPGIKLPAYDAKAKAKTTSDAMCELRRLALKSAFDSAERKAHVAPFLDAAPNFPKMTCDAVKMAFAGGAELAKRANNPVLRTGDTSAPVRDAATRGAIASMNSAAKALWTQAR